MNSIIKRNAISGHVCLILDSLIYYIIICCPIMYISEYVFM